MTVDGFREMVWVEDSHAVGGALREFRARIGADREFCPGNGAAYEFRFRGGADREFCLGNGVACEFRLRGGADREFGAGGGPIVLGGEGWTTAWPFRDARRS